MYETLKRKTAMRAAVGIGQLALLLLEERESAGRGWWRASVPVSPSVCVVDVLVFVGLRFAPELLCRPRKGRYSRKACSRDIIDIDVKKSWID
ncbi:hypothetical protein TNCV_3335321 [Trichonephila clavipes]|nr:hypothetical protein TNCV_3335321 [Trichonephila clavipes]